MDRAARFGRGTFTFIGKTSEVAERMTALFDKLGEPVLTDIAMTLPGESLADVVPDRLPDLYAGEPIVISARLARADGDLDFAGRFGSGAWSTKLALASAVPGKGIGKLWARRKVETLMDRRQDGMAEDAVRDAVLKVALPHQIMSKYTSLVAIDKPVSRPSGEALQSQAVPTNPPKGWTPPSKTGGGNANPMDRAPAPARQQVAQVAIGGTAVQLHARTATPARMKLLVGLLLIALATTMFVFVRRRAL
jgi:Ca-activated chloride channel family protein